MLRALVHKWVIQFDEVAILDKIKITSKSINTKWFHHKIILIAKKISWDKV